LRKIVRNKIQSENYIFYAVQATIGLVETQRKLGYTSLLISFDRITNNKRVCKQVKVLHGEQTIDIFIAKW